MTLMGVGLQTAQAPKMVHLIELAVKTKNQINFAEKA